MATFLDPNINKIRNQTEIANGTKYICKILTKTNSKSNKNSVNIKPTPTEKTILKLC